MLLAKPFLQSAFGSYASCNQSAVPVGSTCIYMSSKLLRRAGRSIRRFKRRRIAPQAPTNADNVPSVHVPSLPAPNMYIPDPDVTDPLARFKRNRKSESSSLSSSSSLPATSSGSSSSSSAACSISSSYSIGGLNYLPPNVPNFFNTILPTLRNEPPSSTPTPGGPASSGELTSAKKAALPVYIRYNAPIKRRLAARKTARAYTYTKRQRRIPREVRPSARERLLGMTLAQLDHLVHSRCCAGGFCYMFVSTELCVQARINNARINNVCKSLKELTAWVASQMEAFDGNQGRHYRIRGWKVCRKMWMRFFGVGEKNMKRALKLYRNNKAFYVQAGPLAGRIVQDDWIYSIMFDYFEKNVQVIADGIWHLQKVDDFENMYKFICEQRVVEVPGVGIAPGPAPRKEAVKRVQKRDWSHVREMRVGEFGICNACYDLQRARDEGFTGEQDAKDWQVANDLHHKIHQICRKHHQNPEGGMPTAEYKQHGDADPHWCGEVKLRPTELPPENWVTQKKREDLYEIFKTGHMSEEEIKWMKEIMDTYQITGIRRDGLYGDEGLPGYPAHLGPCVDRKRHAWLAKNIRVLADLPEGDLWAVPPARFAAREARDSLTADEKKLLPHHEIFSRKPTPQHPKTHPGARVMTDDEKREWHSIGVERDPVDDITAALRKASEEGLTEAEFGKVREVTVPKLKAYCKAKGLAVGGKKADLLTYLGACSDASRSSGRGGE
eukprot:g76207.t1